MKFLMLCPHECGLGPSHPFLGHLDFLSCKLFIPTALPYFFFSNCVVLFKKLICKQSLCIRDLSQSVLQRFALKIFLLSLSASWLGL